MNYTSRFWSLTKRVALALALPALCLALWETAARNVWFPPTQIAPLGAIKSALIQLIGDAETYELLIASLGRLVIGLSGGLIFGLLTGVISASHRFVEWALNPIIGLLAPIPVVVWLPFLIILFGTGESYQVILVGFATFLLVHLYSFTAASAVRKRFASLVNMYELSLGRRIRFFFLPRVLPEVLTSLRVAAIIGWIVLFLVEFGSSDASSSGIAFFIRHQRSMGRIEHAFAAIILLAALTFLVDRGLLAFRYWLERWDERRWERAL